MSRLAGMIFKEKREQELTDEIESHLELHIADNLRSGMSPQEARRQAILKLGGVESTKQAYRERGTLPFLETFLQDLSFAIRQLRKNLAFAFTSILILALGICASVSIFAFVDAALLKPLPYKNPNRLVNVTESIALFPRANLSYPDYLDWKKQNSVFSSMDVWDTTGYLLSTSEGAQPVRGARVSDGFFRTLGVAPILGRDFYAGEDLPSAPHTVMLSYATWQNRFSGRPDVIGQSVALSGVPHTIVGVLARDFQFAPAARAEFWTTLHAADSCDVRRSCHSLDGVGRLKDGVSVQTALADTTSIAAQLEKQYPDSNRGQGAFVAPLSETIVGDIRPVLLVLLAGAGLLLLIACINVSSLLLARSDSRRREIAVRSALGASRQRLVRQFATEGLVLVGSGCVLGIVSAEWVMRALIRLIPAGMLSGMPFLQGIGLNFRVVAFALFISAGAAVLFAVTPILRVSLADLRDGLAEGTRGSAGATWRRFGSHLVVAELIIAMVMLASAGLLAKSLNRLLHVELGFHPDHLATLNVAASDVSYPKQEQVAALARKIVSNVSNLPGVESVGLSSQLVMNGNGNTDWIRFVGRPYNGEHNEVNEREVSSGYFATLGASLLRGRSFTDADDSSKPLVVIINRAFARLYFADEDPIGKRIGDTTLTPASIKQIVGVVDDIREGSLDSKILPAVYYPFYQSPDTDFGLVARTTSAPQSALPMLSGAIHQVDSGLGTVGESTMDDAIANSQTAYLHRSSAWLVAGFACMALLLGVVGLYGVIAYSVSQRTREIGVRMALGAQPGSVYQLILNEAARLTAIGIVVGLACSVAAASLMSKLLFGTQAWDIPTLAGVAALLAIASLLASYIPARRAALVSPVEALRAE